MKSDDYPLNIFVGTPWFVLFCILSFFGGAGTGELISFLCLDNSYAYGSVFESLLELFVFYIISPLKLIIYVGYGLGIIFLIIEVFYIFKVVYLDYSRRRAFFIFMCCHVMANSVYVFAEVGFKSYTIFYFIKTAVIVILIYFGAKFLTWLFMRRLIPYLEKKYYGTENDDK